MIGMTDGSFIQLFTKTPDLDMVLSGWEHEVFYLLFFPCIRYFKKPLGH